MELYEIVNRKIDEKIEKIPDFKEQLRQYLETETLVKATCNFTEAYEANDCYWSDNGCGIQCMNRIAMNVTYHVDIPINKSSNITTNKSSSKSKGDKRKHISKREKQKGKDKL